MMSRLSPDSVNINDYTYVLPDEMIARFPLLNRGSSNLLVYNKGNVSHTNFHNIAKLTGGDGLMIFNNTRVIQARILMNKDTGANIEIFLLGPVSPSEYDLAFTSSSGCRWKCMVGNRKRWKSGTLNKDLIIDNEQSTLSCRIVKDHGSWQEIEFIWKPGYHHFSRIIDAAGSTPLPPYLNRLPADSDKANYQTIYSRFEGSVAAPTAGLHFTKDILKELKNNGVLLDEITLHVGAGTFRPVKSATAGDHEMHSEHFSISIETIKKIRIGLGKITAVGTTSVRTLESIYWLGVKQLSPGEKHPVRNIKNITQDPKQLYKDANQVHHDDNKMYQFNEQRNANKKKQDLVKMAKDQMLLSQWEHLNLSQNIPVNKALDALIGRMERENINKFEAKTEMMIIPGYRFRVTDRMITNFHQPGSTLLLLVAAFIGDDWRKVYDYALNNNFRFLSYGDSSLLIPGNKR